MCLHEVQFYEHETFLLSRVSEFLGAALSAGHAALVIASPEHRAAFVQALAHHGSPPASELIWLDARDTLRQLMVNDELDEARFFDLLGNVITQATQGGARKLHAFGEMVALLCADGKHQVALQLEHLWNKLARQHSLSLLCAYPVAAFAAEEHAQTFEAICSAHSHVSPHEGYAVLPQDPDRFHRTIASLQRKAWSLEREVARRKEAEHSISRLAAHQEQICEDERKRIAGEIHDELGGLLTGIKAYVGVAQERATRQGHPADPQLTEAAQLAATAMVSVRRIITDLRPSILDQLGVWAAIEWYADQIEKQSGLRCHVDIDEASTAELDVKSSNAVFRIVQEALTNVVRHAGASRVDIQVRQDEGAVTVAVADDGNGQAGPDTRETWGIAGMHERARHCGAELRVIARHLQGTTVALRVPLKPAHAGL
ncbi:MAG: MEDS domain-containing protein [Polaromonas sp.]